jgi:hypothetical protein
LGGFNFANSICVFGGENVSGMSETFLADVFKIEQTTTARGDIFLVSVEFIANS